MYTIWFTGLPASGKTTLSQELLNNYLYNAEWLDGDGIREVSHSTLSFSRKDRLTNIDRVRLISYFLNKRKIPTVVSLITPYQECRDRNRKILSNYIEVYVKCSLDTLIQRDPKGLYSRALNGEIQNFTGIDDPFEEPENPDIIVDTENKDIEQSYNEIIKQLGEYLWKRKKFMNLFSRAR